MDGAYLLMLERTQETSQLSLDGLHGSCRRAIHRVGLEYLLAVEEESM